MVPDAEIDSSNNLHTPKFGNHKVEIRLFERKMIFKGRLSRAYTVADGTACMDPMAQR